jgi:integrase/recombinase XerC
MATTALWIPPGVRAVDNTEAMIENHLAWAHQRGLRETTLYARRNYLRQVHTFVETPLLVASRSDLERWFASLIVTAASRGVLLSNVRSFYRWAVKFELIEHDPTVRLDSPVRRRGLPRPISEETLERVLAAAGSRIRPWLYLAAFAGLRACEVSRLRAEDVTDQADPPMLLVVDGKGGKTRAVPLHEKARAALTEADLPSSGFLFLRREWGRPLTTHTPGAGQQNVSPKLVSELANRHLRSHKAGATFHQLRHRFGTRVYSESRDLRVTQELLGHSNPSTTAGYAAWSPARGLAAVLAI